MNTSKRNKRGNTPPKKLYLFFEVGRVTVDATLPNPILDSRLRPNDDKAMQAVATAVSGTLESEADISILTSFQLEWSEPPKTCTKVCV